MAYLAPSEFVTKMVDAGESKIFMSTRDTVIRAYMAGAILALAAAMAVTINVQTGTPIVGAAFYPASGPFGAPWRGGYFFGDFINRFVAYIDLANANAVYLFGRLTDRPVDMMVANDGALLVLTRGTVTRFSKP